jgi:hypothetical protein
MVFIDVIVDDRENPAIDTAGVTQHLRQHGIALIKGV